jgi:acyl-ACP thioesterase
MTVFEPILADKIAFATWASQQNNRFVYAAWDTDVTATQSGNTTSFGPQLNTLALSGTVALTADQNVAALQGTTMQALARPLAALTLGYLASLDFGRTNGRTTFAYRGQAGLLAGVTIRAWATT